MKLVDLGKKLLSNVDILNKKLIKEKVEEFFDTNKGCQYFILLSKEIGYYTIFKAESKDPSIWFIDYLDNSFYNDQANNVHVPMNSILNLELRDDNCLEIWIGTVYFHLAPFDWGVEVI